MPQPALHLLIGRRKLERWRTDRSAPFDATDATAVNAFLHGTLAPDMGNFPGGSRDLAQAVHRRSTAEVVRALFDVARTPAEVAFAWGWLSHVLADVEIHPLVNAAAARHAPNGVMTLTEHVRVEVGLDVWFCSDHALLDRLKLRPAFDRVQYGFVSEVLNGVLGAGVTPQQLVQMERGLIVFSHAAMNFARGSARQLAWKHHGPRPSLPSTLIWHAATRVSRDDSVVNAYLKPHAPADSLVRDVSGAIERVHASFAHYARAGVSELPSYNLEDGTLLSAARGVA